MHGLGRLPTQGEPVGPGKQHDEEKDGMKNEVAHRIFSAGGPRQFDGWVVRGRKGWFAVMARLAIQAAVHNGRFAAVDDAMAEVARLLLREIIQGRPNAAGMASIDAHSESSRSSPDEIVADAMRRRREEPWEAGQEPKSGIGSWSLCSR